MVFWVEVLILLVGLVVVEELVEMDWFVEVYLDLVKMLF